MRNCSLLSKLSNDEWAELLAPDPSPSHYEWSVVLLSRCPVCGEWMTEGSRSRGRCGSCDVWLPEPIRPQPAALDRAA